MKVFTLVAFSFFWAAGSVLGQTQMNLPVTFDEPNVNYGVVGFGGADESSIVADPTDPTNKVAKVVRSNTAELWAGTTITAVVDNRQNGFSSKVPFTATDTKMNVRVWSPDANIPVRLKVEEAADGAKNVETEVRTTVAGAWETLTFDFANPAPNTAPLNLTLNYDKVSIFFNFGVTGAVAGVKTYYFDDIRFGEATVASNSQAANQRVHFYPNPAQHFIEIGGLRQEAVQAQVVDVTGRALPIVFNRAGATHRADVAHLAAGVYFVKIQEGPSSFNLKLIKN